MLYILKLYYNKCGLMLWSSKAPYKYHKKWCIRLLLYIISLMKTNDSSVWGKRLKLKSLFAKNLDIQVGSFHWITWWSSSKNESQICVTFFLPEKKIFWKMYLFFFHTMKVSFGPLLLSLNILQYGLKL